MSSAFIVHIGLEVTVYLGFAFVKATLVLVVMISKIVPLAAWFKVVAKWLVG